MPNQRSLWEYSHAAAIFSAVLLFTAGFLCVLLWTNGIVQTPSSANPATSTFTALSPTVSTFSITYNVAIFGTAWNSILFVTLLVLERDSLPFSKEQLRYEVEKAACIVSVTGNAIYSVACIALMATLARLAADANSTPVDGSDMARAVAASAMDRRAGQGMTAAMAGLAAVTAGWACVMDVLHAHNSRHRRNVKEEPIRGAEDPMKQA